MSVLTIANNEENTFAIEKGTALNLIKDELIQSSAENIKDADRKVLKVREDAIDKAALALGKFWNS